MDYRKDAEFFNGLIKRGAADQVPQRFFECPEMPKHLAWLMEAWQILSPSRQGGFGTGHIPLTEIKAYAELFDVEDVYLLVGVIRELDRIYVQRQNEQQQSN